MRNIVIVGISDTADRIILFIERYKLFNVLGCTVDKVYVPEDGYVILGGGRRHVWPLEELDKYIDRDNDLLFVAVLWNRLNADRRHLYEKVKNMGYKMANIVSPHAMVRGELKGDNCWICDGVVVHEHVVLESDIFIMDQALVGHWTKVEPHVFIAINATVCGAAVIGEQCFVGASSTIFDEVHIGRKCLIGGVVTVKRNVPDFCVVKTSNDTMVLKEYSEDIIETKWLAHHNVR